MPMRDNRFLEPEHGSGVMAWTLRLIAVWLIGGVVLYVAVVNSGLMSPHKAAMNQIATTEGAAPPIVSNSLILRAGRGGYIYVDASVNGTPMHMAFDTGASFVSLTQEDAARAGLAGGLDYSMAFSTANGRTYGAPVTLREIRIGQLAIDDVRAVVMQNLSVSLLGQTFLSRLESYQMRDGVMTLTW